MAEAITSSFTGDDKYFGHCNKNGKLRIWETATGILKQEFTPNLHLTSPCTCLTWISTSRNHVTPSKGKKRKSLDRSLDSEASLDIAALGTASGSILLYSIATGTDEGQLVGGHSTTVNHLTWNRGTNLYSCGDDKLIIEWNLASRQIESKWKAGKERVSCILVFPDGKSLLSAHTSISWWDLSQKRVLRTFKGHASPVVSLTLALGASSGGDSYFVSAAHDDRYLNAWALNASNGNNDVVASFVVEDAPLNVSVSNSGDAGPTTMAVITRSGVMQIFRHQLNGKSAKPLKPKLTIMVAVDTGQDKAAQVTLLPFIDAHLSTEGNVLIAYGTASLISFETISTTFRDKVLCLVRKDRRKQILNNSESVSKVKVPETGEGVTYVSGATSTPHGVKRGAKGKVQSELPMDHRLQNLTLNQPDVEVKAPQINSMAELLLQGLRSKDKRMLQNVLMRREPDIISNTVKQLPVQVIAPLIQELTRIINCKAIVSKTAVSWLKCVLSTHAGQLLATPDLGATFSEVLGAIETRLQVLPPLSRLRGRLDLMVEQIGTGMKRAENGEDLTVLVYQDPDSSDDGSDMEDRLFQGSESGDDSWDEQSVMDDASDVEVQEDDVEAQEDDVEMSEEV